MRDARLKWFGHIKRSVDAPVRRCETIIFLEHVGGWDRLKKNWNEVIRYM